MFAHTKEFQHESLYEYTSKPWNQDVFMMYCCNLHEVLSHLCLQNELKKIEPGRLMAMRNFESTLKWQQEYTEEQWIEQILLSLSSFSDELHPFRKYYLDFFTQKVIYEKKKLLDSIDFLSGSQDRWVHLLRDQSRSAMCRKMELDPYCSIDFKYKGIALESTLKQWEEENYQYVKEKQMQQEYDQTLHTEQVREQLENLNKQQEWDLLDEDQKMKSQE